MASDDGDAESEDERDIDVDGSFAPKFLHISPSASPSASSPINGTMPSNLRPGLTRKQRHAKESRARRRAATQELRPQDDRHLKSAVLKNQMNLEAIATPSDAEEFNAASTGWTGVRIPTEKMNFALEEVTGTLYNLRHVQWDGKYVLFIFVLKY
jgi:hypothetical protein